MSHAIRKIPSKLTALAGGIALWAAPPVWAGNPDAGTFGHLNGDRVIVAILACSILLLTGILLRLRQMNRLLSRRNAAQEKSEQHLQLMGDSLPNETLFQLVCEPGGRFDFNYITKGYERMLGIPRTRVLEDAKLAFDHIYESDIPLLQQAQRRAMESQKPADLEIRMLDIEGNLKWLRISSVPYLDGNTLVWDGLVQDVTESKRVEAALVEEKRNLQNLFSTIDDFLLVCDMSGNLLHANPSVERHLGYSNAELCTMSLFELYPEELRTEAYQVVALMQSESTATCNLPLLKRQSGTIPVEMNIFKGAWKDRQAIFGVARDIGGRRKAEAALRESQQMLQLIMDTIPMAVFWTDKDSLYLGSNKAFIRECGLPASETVAGKTPHDLFDPLIADRMIESDQQIINSNEPQLNELHMFTLPDNRVGWRDTSKIPLHDEEGRAVGVLGVWLDVTEQRQAEERLKRTLDDMERFNQLMRGRERRTLELKAEINQLLLEMGRQVKYQTTTESR